MKRSKYCMRKILNNKKFTKKAIILKNLSQKKNMNKGNNQENLEPKKRI